MESCHSLFRIHRSPLVFVLLTLWVRFLCAEGTAQFMPSGGAASCVSYVCGNDGAGKEGPGYGRPASDYIYVHIKDPDKEMIYYGFTRLEPTGKTVFYQILAPNGTVVCSGKVASTSSDSGFIANNGVAAYVGPRQVVGGTAGYRALIYNPAVAGDYMIRFNVGHISNPKPTEARYYIHPFDVSVVNVENPSAKYVINGRLFAYKWTLNTNSGTNRACMNFYTWTPDSIVIRMDMNGIQPFGYTVSFNSYGVSNTGTIQENRKSRDNMSTTVPEYRVFLNNPDINAYPTGIPGLVSYVNVNTCVTDNSYCIYVQTSKAGEINVFIDLNGDNRYTAGTADVYFPYNVPAGASCIPWDGLNGFGNPVGSEVSGRIVVQYLAGIVHYPVYDPETHQNGFNCYSVRPSILTPLMYWDNTATAIRTSNLTIGCSSGCNSWPTNRGDRVLVNTWMNAITSADTAFFVTSSFCPPVAVKDSACTIANYSIEFEILDNDYDPDGDMDASSVQLSNISDPGANLYYNPVSSMISFIPADDEDTDLTFTYTVCDETDPIYGGPYCNDALVKIYFEESCPGLSVLSPEILALTARWEGNTPHIRWQYRRRWDTQAFEVERSVDGQMFLSAGRIKPEAQPGSDAFFFQDTEAGGLNHRPLYYRLKRVDRQGDIHLSPSVRLDPAPDTGYEFELYPQPAHGQVTLRYAFPAPVSLRVTDLTGKEIYHHPKAIPAGQGEISLPLRDWTPGYYLMVVSTPETVFCRPLQVL